MPNAILKRLKSTHNLNGCHDNDREGYFLIAPRVGESFQFNGTLRMGDSLTTSTVKEIQYDHDKGEILFKTRNTTYLLQVKESK